MNYGPHPPPLHGQVVLRDNANRIEGTIFLMSGWVGVTPDRPLTDVPVPGVTVWLPADRVDIITTEPPK